ncbi:MAG: hypothetical protein IJ877_06900 [Candidatus Gastranaerophilales bacterium]|nr:hypothetical protein [Candidatus Gastranaerophilales bacterium]
MKYFELRKNALDLKKYLINYLNILTSARYGNLNAKADKGFDNITKQLSQIANALLESIRDRDSMINEYIEREKQSQNLKQDFISTLAHDFKVPIIAQDNTYDMLLNNSFGELSETQIDVIKNLKISNNDLRNLVIDLLDAHKLETCDFELNKEKTNLDELIKEVIEQNKCVLSVKNKEIIYKGEKIIANVDAFLIKRLLNNLISNAIFYGKSSKNIYIDLERNKKEIVISVTDEGDGIHEDINKVFKKYYTASKKYSNIGIGLGLYIANKIVSAHKGTINAANKEGMGACFSVKLPA